MWMDGNEQIKTPSDQNVQVVLWLSSINQLRMCVFFFLFSRNRFSSCNVNLHAWLRDANHFELELWVIGCKIQLFLRVPHSACRRRPQYQWYVRLRFRTTKESSLHWLRTSVDKHNQSMKSITKVWKNDREKNRWFALRHRRAEVYLLHNWRSVRACVLAIRNGWDRANVFWSFYRLIPFVKDLFFTLQTTQMRLQVTVIIHLCQWKS